MWKSGGRADGRGHPGGGAGRGVLEAVRRTAFHGRLPWSRRDLSQARSAPGAVAGVTPVPGTGSRPRRECGSMVAAVRATLWPGSRPDRPGPGPAPSPVARRAVTAPRRCRLHPSDRRTARVAARRRDASPSASPWWASPSWASPSWACSWASASSSPPPSAARVATAVAAASRWARRAIWWARQSPEPAGARRPTGSIRAVLGRTGPIGRRPAAAGPGGDERRSGGSRRGLDHGGAGHLPQHHGRVEPAHRGGGQRSAPRQVLAAVARAPQGHPAQHAPQPLHGRRRLGSRGRGDARRHRRAPGEVLALGAGAPHRRPADQAGHPGRGPGALRFAAHRRRPARVRGTCPSRTPARSRVPQPDGAPPGRAAPTATACSGSRSRGRRSGGCRSCGSRLRAPPSGGWGAAAGRGRLRGRPRGPGRRSTRRARAAPAARAPARSRRPGTEEGEWGVAPVVLSMSPPHVCDRSRGRCCGQGET